MYRWDGDEFENGDSKQKIFSAPRIICSVMLCHALFRLERAGNEVKAGPINELLTVTNGCSCTICTMNEWADAWLMGVGDEEGLLHNRWNAAELVHILYGRRHSCSRAGHGLCDSCQPTTPLFYG